MAKSIFGIGSSSLTSMGNYVATQSKLSATVNFLKCNPYARNSILMIAQTVFMGLAIEGINDCLNKYVFSKTSIEKENKEKINYYNHFILPCIINLIAVNVFKVPMPWGYVMSLSISTTMLSLMCNDLQ